jgi:hypothetical protein
MTARAFLSHLIEAVPYTLPALLTDNDIQSARGKGTEGHRDIPFNRICRMQGIAHRLTQAASPGPMAKSSAARN